MLLKLIYIIIITCFSTLSGFSQEVSQMTKFTYNNRWNIKKGDSLRLGKASDETFKFVFDSPSDRENKTYLPKSSSGKSYKIHAIKRYAWNTDAENAYIIIEVNSETYFVDLFDAVQNNEVILPEG